MLNQMSTALLSFSLFSNATAKSSLKGLSSVVAHEHISQITTKMSPLNQLKKLFSNSEH